MHIDMTSTVKTNSIHYFQILVEELKSQLSDNVIGQKVILKIL